MRMTEYYKSTQIGSPFKHEFREIRILTNKFLDAVPDLHVEIDGRLMTRREIIEMVIYGNLSHANEKKRAIYQSWTCSEISKDILDYTFVFILSRLMLPIRELRDLNLRVLATLN